MISGMRVRRRASAGGKKGYKFYRLFITAVQGTGSTHRPAVAELGLVGPSTPTGVPTGGTATASTVHSGSSPDNAFDNNPSTWWSALLQNPAVPPWWLQYEFQSPVELTEYRIRINPNTAQGAPRAFEFQASHDGAVWEVLDAQPSQTGWSNGEQRIFPLT